MSAVPPSATPSAQLPFGSQVRKPRAVVTANGVILRWVAIETIRNANHQSDQFEIRLPLFDPVAQLDWTFWASETDIEIDIEVGFADENEKLGQTTTLMLGAVDAVAMSPIAYGHPGTRERGAALQIGYGGVPQHEEGPTHPEGALLVIRGGDYSRQMMNSPYTNQFTGQQVSSQQIVQAIVANHPQLSLDMSAVSQQVGEAYDSLQGRLFLHRSEWDVVTAIADHLGAQAYMQGRTLVIAPPSNGAGTPFQIWYIPQSGETPAKSNCETLRMSRALNLGKGIDVFVNAYDYQTGRPPSRHVGKVRPSSSSSGTSSSANPYTYSFNHPGLTDQQTQQSALSRAQQIARFERVIEFQMPGDPALTVQTMVNLSGTGTEFDQAYYPDQITDYIDVRRGWLMEARAKNMSQGNSVTVE